jgi:formylglycine-generating enzyme
MIKKLLLIAGSISILALLSFRLYQNLPKPKSIYIQDMILIQGNEDFNSFYLGVSEETNINWMIYRSWLKRVFYESYPAIYEQSKPMSENYTRHIKYNDPGLEDCSTHPAFAYYPVTGVSWEQIQNYLAWKTDRLNEYILLNEGILELDLNQINEDNFNTEAYLGGQYIGIVKKMIQANPNEPKRGRRAQWGDQLFYPGYRLPTEAEWDYAATTVPDLEYVGSENSKFKAHPIKTFLNAKAYLKYAEPSLDYYYSKIKSSEVRFPKTGEFPDQLSSVKEYKKNKYGLANMAGNVMEWCIDTYDINKNTSTDWVEIYRQNRFIAKGKINEEGIITDENNNVVEKDSLGRMSNYRILGGISFEIPLCLAYINPSSEAQNYRVIKGGTYKKPDEKLRGKMAQDSTSIEVGFRCAMTYIKRN